MCYLEPEFLLPLSISFPRFGQTLKMRESAEKSGKQGRLAGETSLRTRLHTARVAPGPAWNRAGPRLQLPVPLALACAQGLGLAFLEAIKKQRLVIT